MLLGDKFEQKALGHYRIGNIQPRKFALLRANLHAVAHRQKSHLIEAVDNPIIKRTVHLELKRAHRVGHALKRILNRVREVVHRVNAPLIAQMVVGDMTDAIQHRVTEVNIGRGHIDFGPEAPFAVRILARLHITEDFQIALGGSIPRGAGLTGLLRNAAVVLPFFLSQITAICLARLNEIFGNLIHLIEHIRGIVEARLARVTGSRPLKAEPTDIPLNVFGVLVAFFRWVRIV